MTSAYSMKPKSFMKSLWSSFHVAVIVECDKFDGFHNVEHIGYAASHGQGIIGPVPVLSCHAPWEPGGLSRVLW